MAGPEQEENKGALRGIFPVFGRQADTLRAEIEQLRAKRASLAKKVDERANAAELQEKIEQLNHLVQRERQDFSDALKRQAEQIRKINGEEPLVFEDDLEPVIPMQRNPRAPRYSWKEKIQNFFGSISKDLIANIAAFAFTALFFTYVPVAAMLAPINVFVLAGMQSVFHFASWMATTKLLGGHIRGPELVGQLISMAGFMASPAMPAFKLGRFAFGGINVVSRPATGLLFSIFTPVAKGANRDRRMRSARPLPRM